jgi:hypothetical protein
MFKVFTNAWKSSSRQTKAGNRRNNRNVYHRRLICEPLEDRQLLSVSVGQEAIQSLNVSPALFVANQGQFSDAAVRYAYQGPGANVLLTDSGPVIQAFQKAATQSEQFSVRFEGANAVSPVGLDQAQTVYNYYVGDSSLWRTGVPTYEKAAYEGLYFGIDLVTWGQGDNLKYEFHVAPGADYQQIVVHYEGIEGLSIDAEGVLHVKTTLGEMTDAAPVIYQQNGDQQVLVAGQFQLIDADTYTFAITGRYDSSLELVIDPSLNWATYLGGTGDDYGDGIAIDGNGDVLVAGQTNSTDFTGAHNSSYGGYDAFVAKVSGSTLAWMTYVGGTGDDLGNAIAVDSGNNALITGETYSHDFALANNTYHGTTFSDAFVAKLTTLGALQWSTFLGGVSPDAGNGIAIDGSGNAMVAGTTASGDFEGAINLPHDSTDAFVAKVGSSGNVVRATFVGGNDVDSGQGIALDSYGNALVTGYTLSVDFDGANNSSHGNYDAFVAKVNTAGTQLWATYLGGDNRDGAYGVAVDWTGNAMVAGTTQSIAFGGGSINTYHGGESDAFVAKVSSTGSFLFAMYLGGSNGDTGSSIAVDGYGDGLVAGSTFSTDFDGASNSNHGEADAFAAWVSGNGSLTIPSAFYLGGSGSDGGTAIAVNDVGNALVTGSTTSTDFAGANNTYNGGTDTFVAQVSFDDGLWSIVGTGDFNGDGTDDILWTNPATGEMGLWIIQNAAYSSWSGLPTVEPGTWAMSGIGDFNADGTDDILWVDTTNGWMGVWIMQNGAFSQWVGLPRAETTVWAVAGVGDFNGDGGSMDVLWRSSANGWVGAWIIQSGAFNRWVGLPYADATVWAMAGVGDYNGNGTDDLLWENLDTGDMGIWILQNGAFNSWVGLPRADISTWSVAGIGDFNDDGADDVLWIDHTDGWVGAWMMQNGAFDHWAGLPQADLTVWNYAGIGDLNGDGTDDVLWLNYSNRWVGAWILQNATVSSWANVGKA